MFFSTPVDRRSRESMVAFLSSHFTYERSYAHCIKLHRIGLNRDLEGRAFELLETDSFLGITSGIRQFERTHECQYTISQAGRCGGYLLLHSSFLERLQYKSICATCGQPNYRLVANGLVGSDGIIADTLASVGSSADNATLLADARIRALSISYHMTEEQKVLAIAKMRPIVNDSTPDNKCGRCGASGEYGRKNLERPLTQLQTRPYPAEPEVELRDLSTEDLRHRVDVVASFDRACDKIRANFIRFISSHRVVQKTIYVPQTISVARPMHHHAAAT